MASPLMLIRAVGGLAIPAALGVAYVKRHRSGRADSAIETTETSSTIRLPAPELRRLLTTGADLTGVDLSGSRLSRMDLSGRSLVRVDLSRASLKDSLLRGCDLTEARLDHADLTRADLREATLTGASLLETTLWQADLSGADLSSCRQMVMANLRRARFDTATRWPPGFEPISAGAIPMKRRAR